MTEVPTVKDGEEDEDETAGAPMDFDSVGVPVLRLSEVLLLYAQRNKRATTNNETYTIFDCVFVVAFAFA
jgi:hypothetical protein